MHVDTTRNKLDSETTGQMIETEKAFTSILSNKSCGCRMWRAITEDHTLNEEFNTEHSCSRGIEFQELEVAVNLSLSHPLD